MERGILRASGKAVRTWRPVIVVDAGTMQIQFEGRGEFEVCRDRAVGQKLERSIVDKP